MSNLIWIAHGLPGGGIVWYGKSFSEEADAPAVEMADKPDRVMATGTWSREIPKADGAYWFVGDAFADRQPTLWLIEDGSVWSFRWEGEYCGKEIEGYWWTAAVEPPELPAPANTPKIAHPQ